MSARLTASAAAVAGRTLRDIVHRERVPMAHLLTVETEHGPYAVVSVDDTLELPSIALIGARARACSELTFVSDAYAALTVRPEEAGELVQRGAVSARWEAGDRDGLTEALIVTSVSRAGELVMLVWTYEELAGELSWAPEPFELPTPGGIVADALRSAFAKVELEGTVNLTAPGLCALYARAGYHAETWTEPSLN